MRLIRNIISMALVLGIILLCVGCGSDDESNGTYADTNDNSYMDSYTNESTRATQEPDYELLEHNWTTDQYSLHYIAGRIKNNTGVKKSYVSVSFNLYDSQGNQIGNAADCISGLEADGIWKFKAMVLYSNVVNYRLAAITGY